MEKFTAVHGIAASFPQENIDTDAIIPARYLRSLGADLAGGLFARSRYLADGKEDPDFVLNRPPFRESRILVAGGNFGCGSSREAAVWALLRFGIRAVIAPSFGDIFYGNSLKNGFLPIVLPADMAAELRAAIEKSPGAHVGVDLEQQQVTGPDGKRYRFEIDPFRKHCLLKGVDELDFTLGYRDEIADFEQRTATEMSWL